MSEKEKQAAEKIAAEVAKLDGVGLEKLELMVTAFSLGVQAAKKEAADAKG